jgi:hypothetical protein
MSDEMNQPAASTGSNKKVLYIVLGIVAVVAILGFLANMSGFMAMRAAGVNVQPGLDGSATYTTDEGTVTVGANKMPDNWPSDAPANFVGATIQYSGSSDPQTGQAGAAVVYTVNASASAVVDHYKAQLADLGWTVQNSANMGASSVISAQKEARVMGISITDAGNGTVQVTAGLNI